MLAVLGMVFVVSCAYKERVQPVSLPSASANAVVVNGVEMVAVSYEESSASSAAYGFDARKAGLLPVQVTMQNNGSSPVRIIPEQTFLLDSKGQAWPVNSLDRTYKRASSHTDIGETVKGTAKPSLLLGAAGAIAGAAIGIVTGENVGSAAGKGAVIGAAAGAVVGGADSYSKAGRSIKDDLREKTLNNRDVLPNQIGYGTLFFPGFQDEASGAVQLKLSLSFGSETKVVTMNLAAPPSSPTNPSPSAQ